MSILRSLISLAPKSTSLNFADQQWLYEVFEFLRLAHIEIHNHEPPELLSIAALNTWTEINIANMESFVNHNIDFESPGARILQTGNYFISWSVSFSMASVTGVEEIHGGIFKNGNIFTSGFAHASVQGVNNINHLSSVTIMALAANDFISLAINNESTDHDVNVEHFDIAIVKLPV